MAMCRAEMQSIGAALACLAFIYTLMPRLPPGLLRLLLILPCLPVFAWVPFSTRPHSLRAVFSFSFLWTCPSKLLLLSWDRSPDYPAPGFLYFLITTVLPVRVKTTEAAASARFKQGFYFLPHILEFLLFFVVLNASQYRERLSVWEIHALYCVLVFLGLQWVLGMSAKLAIVLLGVEIHPHFDNPFVASSLSEFWSRRWNLLASFMLRETVYAPILRLLSPGQQQSAVKRTFDTDKCTRKAGNNAGTLMQGLSPLSKSTQSSNLQEKSISKQQNLQQISSVDKQFGESGIASKYPASARAVAMLASFLASGLIHELIFCCINQTNATWEVTTFFILHGFATVLEGFLRRELPAGWKKVPRPISIFCTLGFMFFSASWLFLPPITRAGTDLRIIEEFNHVQSGILHLFKRH